MFDSTLVKRDDAGSALVGWFEDVARELPWRREPRDPYHVLVSELMLQQTQVDRVVPKFEAFIARFPNVAELAAAEEEAVLEAWSGLGYYRRARMLHGAAKAVQASSGEVPSTLEGLLELPGVGAYTAAAVASLAFGVAAPVIDGNVIRVCTRILAHEDDPRSTAAGRRFREWIAQELMGAEVHPGAVNEALMELGATVCLPSSPQCLLCPLSSLCEARRQGRQSELPRKRAARATENLDWVAACVVSADGDWLLRRIDSGPVLRGLWMPPLDQSGGRGDVVKRARATVEGLTLGGGRRLSEVAHSITFRRISVVPVLFEAEKNEVAEGWSWAAPLKPELPTSSLLKKLARRVEKEGT